MAKLMIELNGRTQELECDDESMISCVLAVAGETDPSRAEASIPAALRWLQGSMESAGVGYAKQLRRQSAIDRVDREVEIKRLQGRASVRINGVLAFPEAQAELDAILEVHS